MANTKKDPKRKKKVEAFKETQKTVAEQQKVPRTHLVPVPFWQSSDVLEMRGDLFEGFEQNLAIAIDALQKVGKMVHYMMQLNIQKDIIKLEYEWNNGEKATDAEIADYKKKAKEYADAQMQAVKDQEANLNAQANAARTGLVDLDGAPLGSDIDHLSDDEEYEEEDLSGSSEENDVVEEDETETA